MSEFIEFGKHCGKKWSDLPDEYLQWIIDGFDPGSKWWLLAEEELARRDEGDDEYTVFMDAEGRDMIFGDS